jgi:hypothetical protein
MTEFPNNSHRARENGDEPEDNAPVRQRKFEKVVTGKAVQRKKPLSRRFVETFVDGSVEGVIDRIVRDILVPAAKDMVMDSVIMGLQRTFHGDDAPMSKHKRGSGSSRYDRGPYTPYNRVGQTASSRRRDDREDHDYRPRAIRDWEDVVVDSRAEADAVLDKMHSALDQYDEVTVLDLYDMVDMNSSFTDDTWGWRSLRGARISRLRGGQYVIELPIPVELRN